MDMRRSSATTLCATNMKALFITFMIVASSIANPILCQSTSPIGTWRLIGHKVDIFDSISNSYSQQELLIKNFEITMIFQKDGSFCQTINSKPKTGKWKLSGNGKKLTIWIRESKQSTRRMIPIDFSSTFDLGECIPEIYKDVKVTQFCGISVYERME